MNIWDRRLARRFSDEENEAVESESDFVAQAPSDNTAQGTEPDYSFDGYSVEFIDKVTFMPIVTKMPPASRPH